MIQRTIDMLWCDWLQVASLRIQLNALVKYGCVCGVEDLHDCMPYRGCGNSHVSFLAKPAQKPAGVVSRVACSGGSCTKN
jgi:hypothetical protein